MAFTNGRSHSRGRFRFIIHKGYVQIGWSIMIGDDVDKKIPMHKIDRVTRKQCITELFISTDASGRNANTIIVL